MEKKYTITLRLSYQQHAWLGALCRRSKQTQSEVIRSLIENGSVRERITQEHIHIIRQLIGESPISISWQDKRTPTVSLLLRTDAKKWLSTLINL